MGNPYRCDDTIGLKIANLLKNQIKNNNIAVKSGSIDGLAMLEEITGFDKVILIDSIKTKNGSPGNIYRIAIDPRKKPASLTASHSIDFITALAMGKKFGYDMPEMISVYAVEIKDNTTFSEECTPDVEKSICEVIQRIADEIN